MLKVSVIVLVSTAIAGILAETQVLQGVEVILQKSHSRSRLFLSTILIGTAAAAFGCTQTIAITLTQQLVQKRYVQHQLSATDLAIDLENTVVVLSPLIPWNIAGLIPATLLLTDAGFIPYACYLYLVPIVSWFAFREWSRKRENFK